MKKVFESFAERERERERERGGDTEKAYSVRVCIVYQVGARACCYARRRGNIACL